jgi:hypothetical protein
MLSRTTDITLSWTTGGSICDVHVWGGSLNITSTAGSCANYHLGTPYGGAYSWQVTAMSSTAGITETSIGPVWRFNVRPAQPLTMTAAGSTPTQVDLAWAASADEPANVDGYKVYFGDGTYLTTLNPGTTRHSVGSLSCNTPYTFYVTTVRQNIESLSSPVASASTLACPPPTTPSIPSPATNALLSRTTDITLAWTTSGNACDVHVWGGSINITITASGCLSYHLGAQYGGAYNWQVTAHNPYGSSPGPQWRFNIQPAAPVTASASALSLTEVSVSWAASSDEPANVDGYKLYAGNGALVTTMGAGVTSHVVQGLSCGTPYSYYVTTVRQNIESLSSPLASVTALACPPPSPPASPTPVDGATFTRSADITLAWVTDGSTCDVHVWGNSLDITNTAGSCTGYHLGVQAGGSYMWEITAHNAHGATPGPQWHFNIQPAPPSSLSAVAPSQSQVNLAWVKSSDDPPNLDAYRIYLGNGTLLATLSAGTTGYILNGLACGTSYSFYVTALREDVESLPSNTATATTQNCPLPNVPAYPIPSDGSILERPSNVILSWTTDGSTCDVHVWGDGIDITTTQGGCIGYLLGVQYGGSYQWQVTAHNIYGATTGPVWRFYIQPYNPTGLTAQAISRTEVALSWVKSADDPGNIDAYKVAFGNGTTITLLSAGSTTYTVGSLSCSTPYTFYVSAVRQGVESAPSNQVSLSTQACPPPSTIVNLAPSYNTTYSRTSNITLLWNTDGTSCDVQVWGGSINITATASSCSSYNLGVQYGGVYSWQVTARNAYGITPGPISRFMVQPAAPPRAVVMTSTQTTMVVSWTKSTDEPANVDGYAIYFANGVYITTTSAGANMYLMSGLTCSTGYTFQVRTMRQGVESTNATTNAGNTKPCPPPTVPSNPSPTDGSTLTRTANVQLNWTTNGTTCDIHVWGGNIDQRYQGVSCAGLQLGTLYGGTYYWQVTARNSSGASYGPTWIFHVQPYAPITITAQAGGHGQINLLWAKSSDDPANVDYYLIYSGDGAPMGSAPMGTLSYTIDPLTCGSSYVFYMVAVRQGVESLPTEATAANTLDCTVYLRSIWMSNGDFTHKTLFYPNDPIAYFAEIVDETNVTNTAIATWTWTLDARSKAVFMNGYPLITNASNPYWMLNSQIAPRASAGVYTYTFSLNYKGTLSSLSVNYQVGARAYVPMLVRP